MRVKSPTQIGGIIETVRKHRGLTQAELGKLAGVSRRAVCELERGKRPNVAAGILRKIINALGGTIICKFGGRLVFTISER